MKIASSDISMSSQQSSVEMSSRTESFKAWGGTQPNPSEQQPAGVILQISQEAKELQQTSVTTISKTGDRNDIWEPSEKDKLKIMLVEELFKTFMRRRIKLHVIDRLKLEDNTIDLQKLKINIMQSQPKAGWGMTYDLEEMHYESEKVNFKADGVIKTEDGKEINIDVNLRMSREFISQESIHARAGDAVMVDPLVINFGGNATQLTDSKFDFDIDSDGDKDQISFVGQGSGFLSLDLNNDGKINDGSELFGPKSGDGFADLSSYDEDNNGWIDENDKIFEKLRIWTKDEKGNDQLFALGQKGVGAIYLGNVSTDFALKGSGNTTNGQLRKTGIFLREDGSAGTVQHIDLAV